jgi:hypothetical protein
MLRILNASIAKKSSIKKFESCPLQPAPKLHRHVRLICFRAVVKKAEIKIRN